jgi:pSer/pThr/pTyr-binding forkhead associated (FHA) protein
MVYAICDSGGRKYMVGNMLRIGSDPANQIVLQDARVSPFHATLTEHQGCLYLRDENSSSGTFVNQAAIQGLVNVPVGAHISIGSSTFAVEQASEQLFLPPPAPRTAKNKGCGCLTMWPLAIYLVLFMACIGLFGGAYWLYKSPRATQQQFLTLIGQGPATIQVENLGDVKVFVFMTSTLERTKEDDITPNFLWEIGSFGTKITANQTTGFYRIDFGTQSGEMDLGTCIFSLKSGEVYDFVVLPDFIIVNRTEYPQVLDRDPTSIDDLAVKTSSLCKVTRP